MIENPSTKVILYARYLCIVSGDRAQEIIRWIRRIGSSYSTNTANQSRMIGGRRQTYLEALVKQTKVGGVETEGAMRIIEYT